MPCRVAAAALSALLAMACRSRDAGVEPGAGEAGVPPAAMDSGERGGSGRESSVAARHDDRFDAEIAENLARVPDPEIHTPGGAGAGANLDNPGFRDRVVAFLRQVSAGGGSVTCELPVTSNRPFRAVVWVTQEGRQVGRGEASDSRLCVSLKDATRRAIAAAGGDGKALAGARFAVDLPDHSYSLVEHQGKGLELSHGLVPVRAVDKALVERRVEEGERYLLRALDRRHKGAHKYYYATTDRFANELHTIYTASTALTLLKLHARSRDKRLLDYVNGAAEFMLSMQSTDEDRAAGGFFYSFDLERGRPDAKLVVGTASKSIFTLLELHALTKEKRHLATATRAAEWLLSMQRPDGRVISMLRGRDPRTRSPDPRGPSDPRTRGPDPRGQSGGGAFTAVEKESMLYTGQVLSALSRMHRATRDAKYLDGAARSAGYLARKVSSEGCYLGDDYRKPNPISSSWAVLALLDFAKATGDARSEETAFRCADELLKRQRRDPEDVYRHGRWQGSLSSSGNGWLAEVMSELYLHCREKGRDGCDRFKDAAVAAIRLLLQYTYSAENAFVVKNPEAAAGGLFWSVTDRYVRTDSVCHAMNAYLNMLDHLGDGPLLELPERPLAARLAAAPGPSAAEERDDEGTNEPGPPAIGGDPDEEGGGRREGRASGCALMRGGGVRLGFRLFNALSLGRRGPLIICPASRRAARGTGAACRG